MLGCILSKGTDCIGSGEGLRLSGNGGAKGTVSVRFRSPYYPAKS